MAATADGYYELERQVQPIGNLLNDSDSGVDHLGYHIYAKALARLLHNCKPPITVGIFAPWGNGKTFLLKYVQGLLRKFERQRGYDVASTKKAKRCASRCSASVNETTSEILANRRPKNKTRKKSRRRFSVCLICSIICILLVCLLIAALAVVVVLNGTSAVNNLNVSGNETISTRGIAQPRIVGNETAAYADNTSGSGVAPRRPLLQGESTDPPPPSDESAAQTTAAADDNSIIITGNVRLYITIALACLAFAVFLVFCCCVANTSSKCWPRFRKNISLVWYAAFTRLPSVTASSTTAWIEEGDPYMIINLNVDRANVTAFDSSEDEEMGEGGSSGQADSMECKYIFVNYHAWEYAGSDILWAGIVTKLSEAIEKEFGAVTVRLFRMLQVERPSKDGPIKSGLRQKTDPRAIYVRVPSVGGEDVSTQYKNLYNLMTEYGVVTRCCLAPVEENGASWWFVRFSNTKEAVSAKDALELSGINVKQEAPPDATNTRGTNVPGNNADVTRRCCVQMEENAENMEMADRRAPSAHDAGESEPLQPSDGAEGEDQQGCRTCSWWQGCCRCYTQFRRHPKTVCCGCPYLYCCVIFVAAALIFPVIVTIMAASLELGVFKSQRAVPVEVQILSWFPATLGVLVVATRFCWAMCHSQTKRIKKSLAGGAAQMANELGFMHNVKKEVMIITQLINCIKFTHRISYKVVITIDDLDRCPSDRVKLVFEAVSILLSDRSSPFLCMVAVDSRVAVKSIEQGMGEMLLQANLTGHEYLKKIINLPFCLPEVAIDAKQKYMGGLMDCADKTKIKKRRVDDADANNRSTNSAFGRARDTLDNVVTDDNIRTVTDGDDNDGQEDVGPDSGETRPGADVDDAGGAPRAQGFRFRETRQKLSFSKFLLACRQFLQSDEFLLRHICGNQRSMKRIFNVLSLTTRMMQCIEEREERRKLLLKYADLQRERREGRRRNAPIMNANFNYDQGVFLGRAQQDAEDLVRWIILADQWPYRFSYILQVIEDSDRRREANVEAPVIEATHTLSDVYERFVEPELATDDVATSSELSQDQDAMLLRSLLRKCTTLTRERAAALFPVTLNLDQYLRKVISRKRLEPKAPTAAAAAAAADDEAGSSENDCRSQVMVDEHAEGQGESATDVTS